eukprot:15628-Heterococcus_DN1.PRE.2
MKIVGAVVGLLCGAAFTSAKQSRLCAFHDGHLIHVCTAAASCLDVMKLTATLCGFVMLGTQSQDQGRCDHREFLTTLLSTGPCEGDYPAGYCCTSQQSEQYSLKQDFSKTLKVGDCSGSGCKVFYNFCACRF